MGADHEVAVGEWGNREIIGRSSSGSRKLTVDNRQLTMTMTMTILLNCYIDILLKSVGNRLMALLVFRVGAI